MKKILSILTISTLTASIPTPLLAAVPLTNTLASNSNNDYLPLKEINGITDRVNSIAVDTKDNIYFCTDNGAFVLKHGATTPTKINGIKGIINHISVDTKDNIYFAGGDGAFVLKHGATTPTKINGINMTAYSVAVDSNDNVYFGTDSGIFLLEKWTTIPKVINGITGKINSLAVDSKNNIYFVVSNLDSIWLMTWLQTIPTKIDGINGRVLSVAVDSNDNVYFSTTGGVYKLSAGATTPTKINGISTQINSLAVDSNDNIYFGTDKGVFIFQTALSWTKTQSQLTVDSTKTQTWTRPDLLSVDGELNIDIANPNIDKVIFDNVQQPQTSKQWKINVKPETTARDHNLQVMFTLDGKQYTSEITVSMQAKIEVKLRSQCKRKL
ncbi:hypothetical protein C6B38_01000, partial [Spiroplasma sp. ChiS]